MRHHLAPRPVVRIALALGLSLSLAGCASMTGEDWRGVLEAVSGVANARAEYKAAKAGVQPAAYQAPAQAAGYGALSCARPVNNAGTLCVQNACGQPVTYHVRFANGSTTSLVVGAGMCQPVPPTVQVFACRGADRFDWGRGACAS
jgi:hypothetical protein